MEHHRAHVIPQIVSATSDPKDLVAGLGGTPADQQLVTDLFEERILVEAASDGNTDPYVQPKRFSLTRSGLEISGIETIARLLYRVVAPVVRSRLGRLFLIAVVVGGIVALALGRPAGPQVSEHPSIDALLGIVLALSCSAAHELAHAVTLVHYGRTPGRAGCGFYWGALCFYVDSTDAVTLPRRARVVNALAGLAVDVVTTAILLMVAQVSSTVLIYAVCWRVAILGLVNMAENALPILEVDGQVALSDLLDEPDLSMRSREALSRLLRRRGQDEQPPWLPWFGAFSITGGVVLLASSAYFWWYAAGDLIRTLLAGSPGDIIVALYLIVPFAAGVIFSSLGLVLELVTSRHTEAGGAKDATDSPAT
ncbi:hypothetical protein [Williamsia limnetica]|uniref:hypothetical protein n=1 Tax=Williamsia limnetica TaxID=882452 RepID=UPI000D7BF454|nr:hypothetical protein [Williamsia limnetica]